MHTVEVNTVIAGALITQTQLFVTIRNLRYLPQKEMLIQLLLLSITYQWYRTNDVARTNWIPIGGETNQDLTFTTALTQSTSFREAIVHLALIQLFVKSITEFATTVLDEVNLEIY